MILAKVLHWFIPSRPGGREYTVAFGYVAGNPILPAEGIHEHAVDEDDGFRFHKDLPAGTLG